jgi:hypothetical protein
MNKNFYYIWGIQRSGTNFLEKLLNLNYNGCKRNGGISAWKHSIDDPADGWSKALPNFIIYKNPYTWIESISYRSTVDYIRTQTLYPATEYIEEDLQLGPKKLNTINLAKTYRHFHSNWLDRDDLKLGMEIKYEDLLVDESRYKILLDISTKMSFVKPDMDRFKIPTTGSVMGSYDYTNDREEYYKSGRPSVLTQKQIDAVTETVGVELITKMGYEVL